MIAATYPDVERAVVDIIADALEDPEPAVTVGVGVPTNWTDANPPHVSVAVDGANTSDHPIVARCTVRFTVRAGSTTEAKRLAGLVLGLAAAHDGSGGVSMMRPTAGVIAARDPDTRAELASCSVLASVRSELIT